MRTAFAAVAALALVPLAMATGRPALPPCEDAFQPFVSIGCFEDSDSSTLLHRSGQNQNDMTVEKCVAECKSNGFRYGGLKYYGVCYCGSVVDAPQLDDSECYEPCSGDKTQTCGSDNTLSVWEDPTFANGPDDVTVADYESLGCYTDSSDVGRTLSFPIDLPADTFTASACIDACREEGFAYAGTEYGSECWCGAILADDSAKVDDSKCNVACKGDSSTKCGGPSLLSLYLAKELESSEPCGYEAPEPVTTTTTTTKAAETTTTQVVDTTTTKPIDTTTTTTKATTTTTTTTKATTTTTKAMCTATQTSAPTCEFQCGKWCAPALPDWSDKAGCLSASKACVVQVASCFKSAGWPAAIDCFEFSGWCSNISKYCSSSDCKKGKHGCFDKYKPDGGKPPVATTTVYPCPVTTTTMKTTTAKPTTTVCPPEPTNICTQPSSDKYGYGPGKPVGGIELPVVGCNDIKSDFTKNPFKLFTSANSRNCPSFSWGSRPDACIDACEEQYDDCRDTYVNSCGNMSWKGGRNHKRFDGESDEAFARRSYRRGKDSVDYSDCAVSDSWKEWSRSGCDAVQCWGRGANNPSTAGNRCKAQYKDCLAVNKKVNPGSSCKKWCDK